MDENISHIVSECDKVAALLQSQQCNTYGFETHEKYYEHFLEMRVLEIDKVKILWDFSIRTDKN